jgi:hypothetical protein
VCRVLERAVSEGRGFRTNGLICSYTLSSVSQHGPACWRDGVAGYRPIIPTPQGGERVIGFFSGLQRDGQTGKDSG